MSKNSEKVKELVDKNGIEPKTDILKFESVKGLEEAYLALEKSYTKKCQELAELKKLQQQNADIAGQNQIEKESENAPKLNEVCGQDNGTIEYWDAKKDSKTMNDKTETCGAVAQKEEKEKEKSLDFVGSFEANKSLPVYLFPLWQSEASEFFATHQLARSMQRAILEEIANNEAISRSRTALFDASAIVMGRALVDGDLDGQFVEALACIPQVEHRVIARYIQNLKLRGHAPKTTQGGGGSPILATASGRSSGAYKTIADAGRALLRTL